MHRFVISKLSIFRKTLQTPRRTLYGGKISGIISQFRLVKKQYQDYIVLFQVGDFYELFEDDAGENS